MAEEKLSFQTEVSRLLNIVANALYSEKQIFLRELISNASDACDRLRYESLTKPKLTADDPEFRVRISVDRKKRTLEIADNGIGMNRENLIDDLGTIARSGTSAYLEELTTGGAAKDGAKGAKSAKGKKAEDDPKNDMALIGQFGVGFYSAFMVADEVEVTSRKAGEDQAWRWTSDGAGEFTIAEAEKESRGTTIRMHLRKGENEFMEPARLRQIIKTYSDHIALPIVLVDDGEEQTINQASAIWTRPKKDITDEQYTEFYHHVGHAFDEPWTTLHWRAEGKLEYTTMLFVPSTKPFDLFDPERKHGVKLYVKRVFITDNCEGLVPRWLRFLRGLVDSEDLPLNVSRELLQDNPMVARIQTTLVKRVLNELGKKADKEPEEFENFWTNFGAVLKEGLYEDSENRASILRVARFHTTASDGLITLDDYIGRMKDGQSAIYYIIGDELETLRRSPQLEGFAARGVEVLLLSDPVDEFWISSVGEYSEKPFKSATRAVSELSEIPVKDEADKSENEADAGKLGGLVAMIRETLGDAVKDVRVSDRLTESAVCLAADDGDIDIHMERMLRQQRQLNTVFTRILEINPKHELIASLAESVGDEGSGKAVEDAAWLLLDQARILEGEQLPDPAAFARRLSAVMSRGLNAA